MTGTAATPATIMVSALAAHGIDRVFCVAGESYLAALDALYDAPQVDVVTCRHEGSAAFMAVADAKLTALPGVCLVNRGPGATNASIGVHAARLDAAPMLLIVGHARSGEIGRRAFQELDCAAMFAGVAKAVFELRDPRRAAEVWQRALRIAGSGTPGPVVVVVPEDVWTLPVDGSNGSAAPAGPRLSWWPRPAPADVESVADLLGAACRPLLIAGSGLDSRRGRDLLRAVSDRCLIPVAAACKRQDIFDNTHPHYAGHLHHGTRPAQRSLLASADLVLAVGTRLDHVTTGAYTFPRAPVPEQPLVHVHRDPEQLGYTCQPTVGLACDPAAFLEALLDTGSTCRADRRRAWAAEVHAVEASDAEWHPLSAPDGIVFGAVVAALGRVLPDDAIVTVDAGNFTSWVHRHLRCAGASRMLGIASSAMGFGLPAAVASSLRHPGRRVVAFVGDGGLLMTAGELATAAACCSSLTVVIANNGSYGTIRQHQERAFPGRVVATDLSNPDFAALARAHGALGLSCRDEREIPDCLEAAHYHRGVALIDVRTSLEWISSNQRLERIRSRDGLAHALAGRDR
jgi:acetolactate synthase I/II/III large subunit